MWYEKLTDRTRKVLTYAAGRARQAGREFVDDVDILFGLVKEERGVVGACLKAYRITEVALQAKLGPIRAVRTPTATGVVLAHSPEYKQVLEKAFEKTVELGQHYVGTEHVLLSMLALETLPACKFLQDLGYNLAELRIWVEGALGLRIDTGEIDVSDLKLLAPENAAGFVRCIDDLFVRLGCTQDQVNAWLPSSGQSTFLSVLKVEITRMIKHISGI